MKIFKSLSALALIAVVCVAVMMRFSYRTNEAGREAGNGFNATTWDALGYYMYLPGLLIYNDVKELKWFPGIDKKYNVSGGELYQATKLEKGGYAFKYLGGAAIMQLPFFCCGHFAAYVSGAPQDGFSWPYQYAIIFGAVVWFAIGLVFLRKVLLRFYSEQTAALTLVCVCLASNLLQYISVDGAMSHSWIFPLYAMQLWFTVRWHEEPKIKYAVAIGFICGLAVISRPTELVMIFIPLLWGIDPSGKLKSKWALVRKHRTQIVFVLIAGLMGVLPQLLYWKYATGSFIYDVGSKWFFFNPWWRILIGFEKGWFIYTPIAIFMVAGLFFLKGKPFRKALVTFSLLNIWVIISWSDWRYGASYSTRALTQSYPVFALALAAFIDFSFRGKWKLLCLAAGGYLVFVNLFQIGQYNSTVLHFDDMNFRYYKAIYLKSNPSPMDYSYLDTGDIVRSDYKLNYSEKLQFKALHADAAKPFTLKTLKPGIGETIRYHLELTADESYRTSWIAVRLFHKGKILKERKFRMAVPKSKPGRLVYEAAFWEGIYKVPADSVQINVETFAELNATNVLLELQSYK